jgi:hypothetical protein
VQSIVQGLRVSVSMDCKHKLQHSLGGGGGCWRHLWLGRSNFGTSRGFLVIEGPFCQALTHTTRARASNSPHECLA